MPKNKTKLSFKKVPYWEVKSQNPGPTVWVTACVHGDEVTGMVVAQEMFKILEKKLLNGRVCSFPVLNPAGLEAGSYHLPSTRENINRAFPGKADGTLAQIIAHKVFSAIIKTKPDVVVDLHNDWTKSVPHALIDQHPEENKKEVNKKMVRFAKASGLLPIFDTTEETKGTLTYALSHRNIPAIALELGESDIVNEDYVKIGISSVLSILNELGMVKEKKFKYPAPKEVGEKVLMYSDHPTTKTSGIVRFLVRPGEFVKKGQPAAVVQDIFGKKLETIKAPGRGVVLGHTNYSVTYPKNHVVSFGLIED